MRIKGILLFFLLNILCGSAIAQTFGARAVLGLNFSQVAGDALAGFDKIGVVGGLKGTAELMDKLHLNVDFLYSQRGSKPNIFNPDVDPDVMINLNYLDLPVYVTYSDWYDEEGGFYKAYFSGGFSYGRLMSQSVRDNFNDGEENLNNLVDDFNKNDFSWLIGFGFRLNRRIGLDFRFTRSITLLYDAPANNVERPSLRPYFISARTEFIF